MKIHLTSKFQLVRNFFVCCWLVGFLSYIYPFGKNLQTIAKPIASQLKSSDSLLELKLLPFVQQYNTLDDLDNKFVHRMYDSLGHWPEYGNIYDLSIEKIRDHVDSLLFDHAIKDGSVRKKVVNIENNSIGLFSHEIELPISYQRLGLPRSIHHSKLFRWWLDYDQLSLETSSPIIFQDSLIGYLNSQYPLRDQYITLINEKFELSRICMFGTAILLGLGMFFMPKKEQPLKRKLYTEDNNQ